MVVEQTLKLDGTGVRIYSVVYEAEFAMHGGFLVVRRDRINTERARRHIASNRREILFRQKYEARLDAWLREIRERAIIEVRM